MRQQEGVASASAQLVFLTLALLCPAGPTLLRWIPREGHRGCLYITDSMPAQHPTPQWGHRGFCGCRGTGSKDFSSLPDATPCRSHGCIDAGVNDNTLSVV